MADIPTAADIFDAARREVLVAPTRFNPEIVDVEGSDVNVILGSAAGIGEEVARFVQASADEVNLRTAQSRGGEVLDRFIYDRYQLVRFEASPSVTTLTLSRTDTSDAETVEAGSVFGTSDGQTFATITDVPFGVGSAGPFDVFAEAEATGPDGNVAVDTINEVISTFRNKSFVVTNAEPAAGGQDDETDDELATRARNFFINARRATQPALVTGALNTPGVAQATAIELLDPKNGAPVFRVQLIISDRDGQANQALVARVRERLRDFRALGTPVQVIAGNPQFITITVENVTFVAGTNTTTVIDQARNAIVQAVNSLAPNETLEQATIFAALKSTVGVLVADDSITEPAGDLIPSSGSVIRTETSRVTINGV